MSFLFFQAEGLIELDTFELKVDTSLESHLKNKKAGIKDEKGPKLVMTVGLAHS